MADTPLSHAERGERGGKNRWANTTPEQRAEEMRRIGELRRRPKPIAEKILELENQFAALSAQVAELRDQVAA